MVCLHNDVIELNAYFAYSILLNPRVDVSLISAVKMLEDLIISFIPIHNEHK